MHSYDANLAALSLGQVETGTFGTAAEAVKCAADGGSWDDESEMCFFADGPLLPTGDSGKTTTNGGVSLKRTDEILFAVGTAAVLAAAIYFWRR